MSLNVKPRAKNFVLSMESISLEMIDFQKDNFPKKLDAYHEKIIKLLEENSKATITKELKAELETLVTDRFKFKIKLNTESELAACIPQPVNTSNVLINKFLKSHEQLAKYYKDAVIDRIDVEDGGIGTVDLKNGTVGGIFTSYVHEVYMNYRKLFLSYKTTKEELTAILLHELGHLFTFYEYSNRSNTTNVVLQNMVSAIMSEDRNKKKTYIYQELGKLNLKEQKSIEKKLDSVFEAENESILQFKTSTFVFDVLSSQMDQSRYDENASERLADQFVSRFGYSEKLAIALEKLGLGSWYNNWIFILEIAVWSRMIYSLVIAFTLIYKGINLSVLGWINFTMVVYLLLIKLINTNYNNQNLTYDYDKDRFIRIKNDIVELLKDRDLDTKIAKSLIIDLNNVEMIINRSRTYASLFKVFGFFLFKTNRTNDESIAVQQMLEKIANNQLFVQSQKLQHI